MMLKTKIFLPAGLFCSAVLAVFTITGCRTATVPVEVTVPGEFNLTGVSKIALVDFNSLPDDPADGTYSADEETLSIVQRMVASFFSQGKMYQIADLDIEKAIAASHPDAKVSNKFDAVIYGRLWWQVSPEYRIEYPEVFTLETWSNVKYDTGKKNRRKEPIYATAHVTRRMEDVIGTRYYRAWNANLMLSLTLYRLTKDGQFEKITDTFAVASQNFIIDNGAFGSNYVPIGADSIDNRANRLKVSMEAKSTFGSLFSSEKNAKDVTGKFVAIQNTATIPTELQTKLMLAGQLSEDLGKKISPSKITFNISFDFGDDKLFNLLKDGAFSAATEYILFTVRKNVGNEIADKIDPLKAAGKILEEQDKKDKTDPEKAYDEPPAEDTRKIADDDVNDAAKDQRDYLYALAVCEEATGYYEEALRTYRYIFSLKPTKEYAFGISRCLFALGMNDRVREKEKAKEKATKETSVK